ncbi:hypothetical protein I7I53_06050 [Histoplasma capsulatum var. duboisii H88]|nr:hypothetical protein I7I53_06050 [Histoplasma capsulatum var. duboisii H88]
MGVLLMESVPLSLAPELSQTLHTMRTIHQRMANAILMRKLCDPIVATSNVVLIEMHMLLDKYFNVLYPLMNARVKLLVDC